MNLCVSSYGPTLDSPVQPVFGRCEYFIFVNPENMEFEPVSNPHACASEDAGILSAKLVADRDATAVITGRVGPYAEAELDAANVDIMIVNRCAVRGAVEKFCRRSPDETSEESSEIHSKNLSGKRQRHAGKDKGVKTSCHDL